MRVHDTLHGIYKPRLYKPNSNCLKLSNTSNTCGIFRGLAPKCPKYERLKVDFGLYESKMEAVYWLARLAAQVGWLGPKVGGHLSPFLYSSREPSELSKCLCYDDSSINIVVVVVIIIIMLFFRRLCTEVHQIKCVT